MPTVHVLLGLQGAVSTSLLLPVHHGEVQTVKFHHMSSSTRIMHISLKRAWGPRQHNITSQALQQVAAGRANMPRCEPDSIEQLQEEVSNHHYLFVQSKGRDSIDADYSVVVQFRDKLQALKSTIIVVSCSCCMSSTGEELKSVKFYLLEN